MSVEVVAMSSIECEQASFFKTSLKCKFVSHLLKEDWRNWSVSVYQFVIFKPLSYCFEETIGFDVSVSLASGAVSRLIKPGDITKQF